jgi:hypothetical protein
MTQAGYLSSHFHDTRAIDARGDPNLLGALVGRMLPIRLRLLETQRILLYRSSEGWACPSTYLLAFEHACRESRQETVPFWDHGSSLPGRLGAGKGCNRGY